MVLFTSRSISGIFDFSNDCITIFDICPSIEFIAMISFLSDNNTVDNTIKENTEIKISNANNGGRRDLLVLFLFLGIYH